MNKFLDEYDLPKLNQEKRNHLNRSIMSNDIETVIKSPNKEKQRAQRIRAKFYQTFKDELTPLFFKLFSKI
jgi:hypothetical protein